MSTSILERLKAIGTRKRTSARAKHFEFVRAVASGKELSEKLAEEWMVALETAGISEADAGEHVALVRRIEAAEVHAKQAALSRQQIDQHQATIDELRTKITTLEEQLKNATQMQASCTAQFHNATRMVNEAAELKSRLAALESDTAVPA